MVELSDNSINRSSTDLSLPTGEGIVIDIGTGDGLFVYQCARENPAKFFIGIDANVRPLEKVSEKIQRKKAKGGLRNLIFVRAAVEELPPELDAVANEVHVHFPWGSLLQGVAAGRIDVLRSLRRICAPEAMLEVIIGIDPERDRSELVRLGVQPLTVDHIDSVLSPLYRNAGFEIVERGEVPPSEWPKLRTSWARRLKSGAGRSLTYFIARAT